MKFGRNAKTKKGINMATVTLTKDNFEQVVTDNNFVVIDFWAQPSLHSPIDRAQRPLGQMSSSIEQPS